MSKKQEINFTDDDLQSLFINEIIKIGNKEIIIEPFELEDFPIISKYFNEGLSNKFKEKKININNVFESKNIPIVAEIIASGCPKILSYATGIKVNDLNRMPASIPISIALAVVNVNLQAQGGLEKNLIDLVGAAIAQFTKTVTMLTKTLNSELVISPKDLSQTDIPGKILKATTSAK